MPIFFETEEVIEDPCLEARIASRPGQLDDLTVLLDGDPVSWELFPKYAVDPPDCQYTLQITAIGLETYL